MSGLTIKSDLSEGLKRYFKMTTVGGEVDKKAKAIVGLQLLNNIVNGSELTSVIPPIDTGMLRGSGSVFVGSIFVGDSQSEFPEGKPNKAHSDKDEVLTVGFDVPYAAKMHEWEGGYREKSERSGNVGNKFVEHHLDGDKKELMQLYADIVKKETSN